MANKEKTGKKKQGIVQRMMFGRDDKPDLTPEQLNMSKWAMFKYLFFNRFGTMVFLNLLTLLFALPAIAVILLFFMNSTVANGFIPYSANIFIGNNVVVNAVNQGNISAFTYQLFEFLVLVPCIAVFAVGVSGNLYVIRKLIWEEPTHTFKDFFRGIGKCWLPSLLIGIAFGLTLVLVVFSLGYFDAYGMSVSLKALSVTLSMILLVFMIIFTSFFMTQNVAFKMRPMVLIRNSVLFVFGALLQSIIFIGIGLIPVYLMFIPGITVLLVMIYVFLGFSFSTLVISLFCHACYEKFLYDKITDKPSRVYSKRESDLEEPASEKQKKKAPATYKNPKKRKKSIDEGSSITPLTPTFRREDLERLQREHEQVLKESNDVSDGEDTEEEQADNTKETGQSDTDN